MRKCLKSDRSIKAINITESLERKRKKSKELIDMMNKVRKAKN